MPGVGGGRAGVYIDRCIKNSKNDFQLPKCKTEYYGKSFAIQSGAKVWNSLPESLKEAQALKSFKKQLRKHLHQHDK